MLEFLCSQKVEAFFHCFYRAITSPYHMETVRSLYVWPILIICIVTNSFDYLYAFYINSGVELLLYVAFQMRGKCSSTFH